LTTEHLPKGQKYDQDYIVSDILSELEREKWDTSGGGKVGLCPYTWITQKVMMMAKSKTNSIGNALCTVLTFENVSSVFSEWKIYLNWVMENGGEYYFESSKKNGNLLNKHSQGILSARFLGTLY
jgi:hypothetical protein